MPVKMRDLLLGLASDGKILMLQECIIKLLSCSSIFLISFYHTVALNVYLLFRI